MMNIDKVLLYLIVANVLFSVLGFKDSNFKNKYLFNISGIKQKQYYRMFSSGFLHADIIHLVFNMYTLYLFAPTIIGKKNAFIFLIIYLISLFSGSLLSFIYHHSNNYYSALGASGAVSGIIFSAILMNSGLRIFGLPDYIFGALYILYSVYGMKKQLGNIGHSAHLGGAIGGLLTTLLMFPSLVFSNTITVLYLGIQLILAFIFKNKI